MSVRGAKQILFWWASGRACRNSPCRYFICLRVRHSSAGRGKCCSAGDAQNHPHWELL